jgi:lysophospholipase L1-like esterase
MRICFFGDSFTAGSGDDDGLGWVGRVVAKARGAGRDVIPYNLGVCGDTSAGIAARWKREADVRLPADRPDLDGRFVFSFGANDCCPLGDSIDPRVSRAASAAHAEAILVAAKAWRPTLMIGPGILASSREDTARVVRLSTDYGALSARIGVPYLDLAPILIASTAWNDEARAGDGDHPNRGGYAVVADAIAAWPAWRAWIEET